MDKESIIKCELENPDLMAIWAIPMSSFNYSLSLTIFIIKCGRENPDAGILCSGD